VARCGHSTATGTTDFAGNVAVKPFSVTFMASKIAGLTVSIWPPGLDSSHAGATIAVSCASGAPWLFQKGKIMKSPWITPVAFVGLLCVVGFAVLALLQGAEPAETPKIEGAPKSEGPALKTGKEKISYVLGTNVGRQFKGQMIELDLPSFSKGVEHAMEGKPLLMTPAEMRDMMQVLQAEIRAKQADAGSKNKKDGEIFLEENKKKPGVIALPSGLQYKVIQEGTGPKPTATDKVTTHYRGTLIDGTEFDSSYSRGQPMSFQVDGVIAGWTEALQLMPAGSKWQLFIPSNLAYKERGSPPNIGPNSTLIFEVELISID
jgi:FKBP-type peptidyl-prolyl cis-trans isomerase FklB